MQSGREARGDESIENPFSVQLDGTGEEDHSESEEDGDEGDTLNDGNGSDSANVQDGSIRKEWMHFKLQDCFKCTEALESLLENIMFALAETLKLGFLPF